MRPSNSTPIEHRAGDDDASADLGQRQDPALLHRLISGVLIAVAGNAAPAFRRRRRRRAAALRVGADREHGKAGSGKQKQKNASIKNSIMFGGLASS